MSGFVTQNSSRMDASTVTLSGVRMPNKMGDQQDSRAAEGFNSGPVIGQDDAASKSNLARDRDPQICQEGTGPTAGLLSRALRGGKCWQGLFEASSSPL